MDPLSVIFVPGGIAMALAMLSPLAVLGHRFWRRRGFRRNDERRCGRCRAAFTPDGDLYRFSGVLVCARCANVWRRRLAVLIPGALVGSVVLGASAGVALWLIESSGGFGLAWWLSGKYVAVILPSLGLATATLVAIRAGRRANALAAGSERTPLLPRFHPHAPVRLRLAPLHHTMPTEP